MAPKLPLEGIRVLDFGWRAVAPLAARLLAWGGAEVIRIESALRHDDARLTPPLTPGVSGFNVSGWWNDMNCNKLSITLNLRDPRGRELALRLVSMSDIVVENFSAGTMEKMGFGYDVLRQCKRDIIMASHSLSGQTGRWKYVKGHGPMAAAMAGLHYLSGYADTPPSSPGFAYTDYSVNPHHSAFALLAALHYRRRTGEGQYIDLSQYESSVNVLGPAVLEYTVLGRIRLRLGNRSPYAAPQGIYTCLPVEYRGKSHDHWCAIAVTTDEEWRSLCQVMGRPELAQDARYATFADRKGLEEEIDEIISSWTRDSEARDIMLQLQAAGVASGVVQNPKDLLENDPQLAARGHYRKIVHAEAGNTLYNGPPFLLSECPIELCPAPLLGEHNDYVFKQLLHLTEEEINHGYAENYIA